MSETQLSSAIISALQITPGVVCVIRINSGLVSVRGAKMRLASKGTPDLLLMLRHGRTLWLEIKTDNGKLSDDQIAWHNMADLNGHIVRVVRTVQGAIDAVTGRDGT